MIQIDEKIFNNEKWIGGRVKDLEDMCGGEKSREKKNKIKRNDID